MENLLILASVFLVVLLVAYPVLDSFSRRREVAEKISGVRNAYHSMDAKDAEKLDEIIGSDNKFIRHYFDVSKKMDADSIEFRLIRAGYFSPTAPRTFQQIRAVVSVLVFVVTAYLVLNSFETVSPLLVVVFSGLFSGVTFILANAVLDKIGSSTQTRYRKLFPDFMDLLIVCVDAGLSIEAAVDRVMREFLQTHRDFGIHLSIITLEVRAGRALTDALKNFAERIDVDEARSLAILFKQSEELGASVTKTLRTYSAEMRQQRMIRAEEKANSLPVKMLFPMAFFMFPTNLLIVLVPVGITIVQMFVSLAPS